MKLRFGNLTKSRIGKGAFRKAVYACDSLLTLKYAGVSLVIAGKGRMRTINRTYRGIDKATDVLSFPLWKGKLERDTFLGEIFICPSLLPHDMTKSQGLQFLFIHGVLHLLGYDHITDKEYTKMRKWEKALFSLCL